MEYHDRVLKCSECSAEFVFTAGEQMFFADKGFKNEPKRCKACKAKRAEGGGGGGGGHASPVREGNHSSLPSHTRAAGFLPGMLPATQGDGRGVEQKIEVVSQTCRRIARTTNCFAWDGLAYPSHFFVPSTARRSHLGVRIKIGTELGKASDIFCIGVPRLLVDTSWQQDI
jgi:Probable zinc-ribbon domain